MSKGMLYCELHDTDCAWMRYGNCMASRCNINDAEYIESRKQQQKRQQELYEKELEYKLEEKAAAENIRTQRVTAEENLKKDIEYTRRKMERCYTRGYTQRAEGFQMMMDLGSSVADIVKNTGFSESTVRHRLKLMDLDQDLLQEKSQQNINMFDLIKLEQIKEPEQKNKALEKIGTKEFNWTLQNILDGQIKEEKIVAFIEKFEPYVPIHRSYIGGTILIKSWNISNTELEDIKAIDVEALCNDIEGKVSLYITTYNWVELQRERSVEPEPETEEENAERARKAEIEKERCAKLEDIKTKMFESRMRFVKHLSIKKAKENISNTIKTATMKIATDRLYAWDIDENVSEILDVDYEESETPDEDYENVVKQRSKKYPELTLFQVVYCGMERQGKTWDYYYHYEKNEKLEDLYQFLSVYGYEMSTEEQQIIDGTHELYKVEE